MGTQSKFHRRRSRSTGSIQPLSTSLTASRYDLESVADSIAILETPAVRERKVTRHQWPGEKPDTLTELDTKSQGTGTKKPAVKKTRRDRQWAKKVIRAEVRSIVRRIEPSMWTELQISLVRRYGRLIPMNPVMWELFAVPDVPEQDNEERPYHLA